MTREGAQLVLTRMPGRRTARRGVPIARAVLLGVTMRQAVNAVSGGSRLAIGFERGEFWAALTFERAVLSFPRPGTLTSDECAKASF
jgi:hypothetical protein